MQAVAELLNSGDSEANNLFKQLYATPTDANISSRLISLANTKGSTPNYMRGSEYKSPTEWDQKVGVSSSVSEAKRDKTTTKPAAKPAAKPAESKPEAKKGRRVNTATPLKK